MNEYVTMFRGLRATGNTEEDAAELVDLAMHIEHDRKRAQQAPQQKQEMRIMAKLPGTNGGNGRASIVQSYELESTHNSLKTVPSDLAELAGRVAGLRANLIEVKKINLPDAKSALDSAITGATMEAYGAGVITGKNQAERDLQVSSYLDKDSAIQEARESLWDWETKLASIEARLEIVEADYKVAWAKLSAARADAALQTAYLQFLTAGGSVDTEAGEDGRYVYEQPF